MFVNNLIVIFAHYWIPQLVSYLHPVSSNFVENDNTGQNSSHHYAEAQSYDSLPIQVFMPSDTGPVTYLRSLLIRDWAHSLHSS